MSTDIDSGHNKSESTSPIIISKGASQKSKHLSLAKLSVAVWPAIIGLSSATLLVGVVVAYYWGSDVSSNSSSYSNVTQAWGTALDATSILFALVVAIGLPIWWGKFKSTRRALASIAFEVFFLGLAILVSGFILFHNNATGNNNGVIPGGCGCGGGGLYGAQICCYKTN